MWERGVIESAGYQMPLAQIARCYAYAEAKGDPRAEKFLDHLAVHAPGHEVERLIGDAEAHPDIAALIAERHAQPSLFEEAS